MKSIKGNGIIIVLAAVALLGTATFASAQWGYGRHMGWGRGGDMMGDSGGDNCPRYGRGYGNGPRGYEYENEMTEEQFKQFDEERTRFFKETDALRRNIYQKQLALRSELAKESPDAAAAKMLQKEISQLRSEFDQKRLEHQMTMNRIAPEGGGCFKGRGGRLGMGYGPGQGRGMMGYGPGQGGNSGPGAE